MGQQTIIRDGFVSKGDSQFNGSAEIINTSGFGLTITGSSAGAFIGNRSGGVHTLTMQADTAGRGLLILNSTGSTANYAVKGLDVNVQSNVSNIQSYAQVNIGTTQPLTLNSLGGFVGINTGNNVTPSAALHVKGSGATSGTTALRIENSNATSSLTVRDDGLISAMPNNANITIDGSTSSGGRIIIQNPSSNSLIGINSYNTFLYPTELVIFAGSAIKGYINGLGDFRFYNLSTSKTYMYISTTGLIGINKGTVTPNAELDVSGSVIVTGSLKVTGGITGSLQGTATSASFVNPLNQNVIITGSASNSLRVKGSGSTSATNTVYVENSSGQNTFLIKDDGAVTIDPGSGYTGNVLTLRSRNGTVGFYGDASSILRATSNFGVDGTLYLFGNISFQQLGTTITFNQNYLTGLAGINVNEASQGYVKVLHDYNAYAAQANQGVIVYSKNRTSGNYPQAAFQTHVSGSINDTAYLVSTRGFGYFRNSKADEPTLKLIASGGLAYTADYLQIIDSSSAIVAKINSGGSIWTSTYVSASSFTGSLLGTATSASFASTASFVNRLNQNVLITGSLTVGATSLGANENTLVVGPSPAGGTGEGGQILLQAVGGTYTTASMIDNYQDTLRFLRGTNAGSDAYKMLINMHSGQIQMPNYNSTSAFTGTVAGILGFDSNGMLLTTTASSGGGGGGSGTVNSGTAGKVAYYATAGTAVSETGTLKWDDGNNSLGVGVAAPTNANYKLAVNGGIDIGNDTTAVLRIGAHLAGSGYPQAVIQMGANATRFDFEKYGGGVQFTVSSSGDCKVSNSLGVGMDASGTSGRIDASNDIVAFSTSDIRWKTNIKPIENPIEKIKQISGNTFEWIEDSKFHGNTGKDVGVIAQEIEAILPEIVTTRDTGMKAVKYEKLVALLIEAVKEQQKQIDELNAKL